MDITRLENKYKELTANLEMEKSPRISILLINDFLSFLYKYEDENLFECYFIEYIERYIELLNNFKVFGININITENIITNAKKLLQIKIFGDYHNGLRLAIDKLEERKEKLKSILSGEDSSEISEENTGIAFPVIEKHEFRNKYYGLIENLTVTIHKKNKNDEDSFIIVPSHIDIEKQLASQIRTSWKIAKQICGEYIGKFYFSHEIIIKFSEKHGNYVGDSFGIALTLGLIEELHKLYNLPYNVTVNNSALFTGGIDENGIIKSVSENAIKTKAETAFFSCKTIFVIPKKDESTAFNTISTLNKSYPERKLKLLPVEELSDLLNRRDLVKIEKQNLLHRYVKSIEKHIAVFILLFIVFITILFNALKYLDPTPYQIVDKPYLLQIKNQYGRILFTKKVNYNYEKMIPLTLIEYKRRLIDINNDGIKELLLLDEKENEEDMGIPIGSLSCYNEKGDLIWRYVFKDSVKTIEGSFPSDFLIETILCINNENNKKVVYAVANNIVNYPSVVIRINGADGKRLPGKLWHPGKITAGLIGDYNNDNKKELILLGMNNGFGYSIVCSINLDEFKYERSSPSTESHLFLNLKYARFNKYLLLPKSDYNSFYHRFYNIPASIIYSNTSKKFLITTIEGELKDGIASITYYLDSHLSNPEILLSEVFQRKRDSLVKSGKLPPPLSNTKEYKNKLKEQFKEWDFINNKLINLN